MLFQDLLLFALQFFPNFQNYKGSFSTFSYYGHKNSPRIKGLLGIIYAEMNNAQKKINILSAASSASYLAFTEHVSSAQQSRSRIQFSVLKKKRTPESPIQEFLSK